MQFDDIVYYGVFLNEESQALLRNYLNSYQLDPERTKVYCHHMTIIHHSQFKYPDSQWLIDWCEKHDGEKVYLKVWQFGLSPKACALGVVPFLANGEELVPCDNLRKHITLCTFDGSSPYESNNIEKWEFEEFNELLVGKVGKWYTRNKESNAVLEKC